jgi:periplasmic copper chaperone A
MKGRLLFVGALALLALPIGEAQAHVSFETAQAAVGSGYKAVLRVPHGCEGSATVEIKIDIPEGVIAVKPMPKPGWTIKLAKGTYARSYAFYHGKQLAEGVRQVTWTGGPLPDDYFDEFVLSTFIAAELKPGTKLSFPVTQRCETGETRWVEVAKDGEDAHALKSPAPQLMLTAGEDDHHHHAAAVPAPAGSGNVLMKDAWTRATPGAATAAAGYLTITNTGKESDVLLGASSDAADRVELHETATGSDGVSTMRPLPDGLTILPGETVELKPLGRHLMLLGLKAPLKEGQTLMLQLTFKHAGAVRVPFVVTPVGASAAHVH